MGHQQLWSDIQVAIRLLNSNEQFDVEWSKLIVHISQCVNVDRVDSNGIERQVNFML